MGEGTSPPRTFAGSGRTAGSAMGIAASRAAVYGCAGCEKRVEGGATSQSLPRYMTATRSLTLRTTPRSWAMKIIVSP